MSVTKPTITQRKTLEKDVSLGRILRSTMQYYDVFSDSYVTFYDNWTKAEDVFSDGEYKEGYDRVAKRGFEFLREVSRVVKENGWLVISDSYWRGQKGGKEQIQVRRTDEGTYDIYKYYYKPEELCNLVDNAFGTHSHMETTRFELICVARKEFYQNLCCSR